MMSSCNRPHSGLETVMLLAIFTIFCVYILTSDVELPVVVEWRSDSDNIRNSSLTDDNTTLPHLDVFDECVLRVYDPFYKGIKKVVRYKQPLKDCNRNYTPPTRLINGKVSIHPSRTKDYDLCSASCLEHISAIKTRAVAWRNFTKNDKLEMKCDFIWTKCYKKNKNVDDYVHMQIVEKTESVTPQPKPTQFRPNVYVIVVDSVSSTQLLRSFPKTVEFLKRNMSAVFFHHLNRIGENSRPNAYALTLGWRTIDVNREAIGASNLPPEEGRDRDRVYNTYRDNDSTIFNEYKHAGYKTAWIEDWGTGDVYSYPSCKGTLKQHTTHTIRPFVNILKQKSVKKNHGPENCFEVARDALDYTGLFVNSYKGQPKFSLSWMATISHGDANKLFHEDDYFEEFFVKHESLFRGSFVFFQGDHGLRFGSNLNTELGKREINNPFLMVTVPEFLRKNDKLMGTLEENAMKLVTQYDVHATLVDILKHAPQSNFTNFDHKTIFEENPNNATSLIRPLGSFGRRNCKNVPLSFKYCLCEFEKEKIRDEKFKSDALKFLVDHINDLLGEHNATELCSKIKPDRVHGMRAYTPETVYRLYEVIFTTRPRGGKFKANLRYDVPTKSFHLPSPIERLNAYGNAGDCVEKDLDIVPFCNCINQ